MVMKNYNYATAGTMVRSEVYPHWPSGNNTSSVAVDKVRRILRSVYSAPGKPDVPGNRVTGQAYDYVKLSSGGASWSYETGTYPYDHTVSYFGDIVVPPGCNEPWSKTALTSYDKTAVFNGAIEKLNEAVRGSTDVSIDLAQMRQTASMVGAETLTFGKGFVDREIATRCNKIDRFIGNFARLPSLQSWFRTYGGKTKYGTLKRGVLKSSWRAYQSSFGKVDPRTLLKGPAGAWLTFVYGIAPSMSTIYDVVRFDTNKHLNSGQKYQSRKSRVNTRVEVHTDIDWPVHPSRVTLTVKSSYREELGVWMCIPDDAHDWVNRLTSMNPLSIAWELTPYSFVLDWFVNIGGYIRDVETSFMYNSYLKEGWRTRTERHEIQADGYPTGSGVTGFARATAYEIIKQRERLIHYPAPSVPTLNLKLGSGRLLNAAALLSNFLGK